jgi:predicted esterase
MKKDKAFLESIGWKTGWMEFEGGHTVAPEAIYEHAADWLEQEIGNGTKN